MSFKLSDVLRAIASVLEAPCVAVLILIIAATVILFGTIIAEYFYERRRMKAALPELLEKLRIGGDMKECIETSGLLRRQKLALNEIISHPDFSNNVREALAVRLTEIEQKHYDGIVRISELCARLGPMFGLLGTLIPLGPGIIALGQGDTFTLSNSLLVAFDTTIAGLISAAVATVISTVRRAWYKDYMSIFDTVIEAVLERAETESIA